MKAIIVLILMHMVVLANNPYCKLKPGDRVNYTPENQYMHVVNVDSIGMIDAIHVETDGAPFKYKAKWYSKKACRLFTIIPDPKKIKKGER